MKNIKKFLLIVLTCLVICFASNLKADSGWDGDYDYDYGSSDWDFDFDFGDHSSTSRPRRTSSGGDLAGGAAAFAIFALICLGITAYILIKYSKPKNNNKVSDYNNNNLDNVDINNIKEILPDFDINEFRQKAYEVYKNIQISWMNFDFDELKKNTTNELFNLYKSELMALKTKKQKNIMSDFYLHNFDIINVEKGIDNVSIKVEMVISCYDYVINKNDEVMRGIKTRKVEYKYEMTFTKGLEKANNKCPNCNAPLDNITTSVCPYCNSTVISSNHDWVLSKKQIKTQKLK